MSKELVQIARLELATAAAYQAARSNHIELYLYYITYTKSTGII